MFTGVVIDCESKQPLEGAIVTAKDPRGNEVATIKTQAGGRYTIQTDAGIALQISGRQDDYQNNLLTAYPSERRYRICSGVMFNKKARSV